MERREARVDRWYGVYRGRKWKVEGWFSDEMDVGEVEGRREEWSRREEKKYGVRLGHYNMMD